MNAESSSDPQQKQSRATICQLHTIWRVETTHEESASCATVVGTVARNGPGLSRELGENHETHSLTEAGQSSLESEVFQQPATLGPLPSPQGVKPLTIMTA